ncbi:TIGR03016 family PEP-CTERM system-associated outer membrane protein [Kordiimonas pumila]|uniref:TIGR03016 family PEP-CTERM system-associated outer membrane protein n=1 Tax=Kordiimonas pumila TaxID=2161677 RepID=A0ABV7D2I1_9PROT|nr:TIGR03016 family PEP-CTERM system-associated outer membrane protein [Kordiimonas pumila]
MQTAAPYRKAARVAVFFLLPVVSLQAAYAQHVWIDPRGEGRVTLTDNANLTESDRVQDAVLNLSPGINVHVESARTRLALDYAYDYYYYLSDGGHDVRHKMFSTLDSEIWKDHLSINGRASISQQYLNQRGSLSSSFANRTDNRRTLQNYTGTAILKGGLRDYADWRMTYRYGVSLSPADNLDDETLTSNFSDSTSQELTASLGSGDRFTHFEWRLYADSSKVSRSLETNDFRNEHVGAELKYKFNRFFSLLGSVSYSSNDFQSAILSEQGFGWDAGFRWTPGRKLDLTVRHGREGSRKTWYATMQYLITSRVQLTGSYQDIITANTIVGNDTLQSYQFNDDIGIIDSQGLPSDESDPKFSFSDIDFRRRVAKMTLSWRHKRTDAYITANYERRTFDNDSGTANSYGTSTGFKHKINKSTTLSGSLGYRRSEFENSDRVDDYFEGNLDWAKTVSRYFKIAVGYGHSERLSTAQGADIEENTLTFYIRGTY